MAKDRTMTFRASGKQILKAGQHYADASTDEAARAIVAALNLPAALDDRARRASLKGNRAMARVCRVLADDLRAGVMEEYMAGLQWGNVPVPNTASWTAEVGLSHGPCPHVADACVQALLPSPSPAVGK